MSADNGIYILASPAPQLGTVYRVAHASAIDNFDWYKNHQPHNLGAYMLVVWGHSEVFFDRAAALAAAHKMRDSYGGFVEYGICDIHADQTFYGDEFRYKTIPANAPSLTRL